MNMDKAAILKSNSNSVFASNDDTNSSNIFVGGDKHVIHSNR